MKRVRRTALLLLLGTGCASHGGEATDAKAVPSEPVPVVPEPKAQDEAAPEEPIGAGDPRQPVPGPSGDMAPAEINFDGRTTADTSHERNTFADAGLAPVADRLSGERIEVASVREFVTALGSDRTIVMKPGVYVWRDGDVLGYSDAEESYEELSEHWKDGTIHDVRNLAIVGLGAGARILQPDSYDHVLAFQNVEGLTLYNLILGHHVDHGWCAGGVVRIIGGQDIVIDGVEMFGSGTEGLTITHVEDVLVRKSVVWGCSEQLSTIFNAKNVRIQDTIFRDNGPDLLRGFNLARSEVKFERVTVRDNSSGSTSAGYGTLFSAASGYAALPGVTDHGDPKRKVDGPKSVRISFTDGAIVDNRFKAMSDRSESVRIRKSRVENNGFD